MLTHVHPFHTGHFFLLVLNLARLHTFILVDDDLEQVGSDRGVEFNGVTFARFGQSGVLSRCQLFR